MSDNRTTELTAVADDESVEKHCLKYIQVRTPSRAVKNADLWIFCEHASVDHRSAVQ